MKNKRKPSSVKKPILTAEDVQEFFDLNNQWINHRKGGNLPTIESAIREWLLSSECTSSKGKILRIIQCQRARGIVGTRLFFFPLGPSHINCVTWVFELQGFNGDTKTVYIPLDDVLGRRERFLLLRYIRMAVEDATIDYGRPLVGEWYQGLLLFVSKLCRTRESQSYYLLAAGDLKRDIRDLQREKRHFAILHIVAIWRTVITICHAIADWLLRTAKEIANLFRSNDR